MARIGIDATSAALLGKGVSRYQKNIVESLSKLNSVHDYFVFFNQSHSPFSALSRPHWHFIPVKIGWAAIWEQFQLPHYVDRLKLNLIHFTSDRIPLGLKIPAVLYLFEIPQYRIAWARRTGKKEGLKEKISNEVTSLIFQTTTKYARLIMTSSESTKRDLMEEFKVSPQRIRTVYPACEESFHSSIDDETITRIRKEIGCPEGYVLHFSTGDPRENSEAVIQAFCKAEAKISKRINLVIAGGGGLSNNGLSERIVRLPFLTGQRLTTIYQAASLYLDLSLYEGFGFQILEAMACRVPIIASRCTSIPEIVGSTGILVDPLDVVSAAEGMVRILSDPDLKDEMKRKGQARARQFGWGKTARETLGVYEEILNGD